MLDGRNIALGAKLLLALNAARGLLWGKLRAILGVEGLGFRVWGLGFRV